MAVPAAAQSVRGQLTDSVSRTPLAGAFLAAIDPIPIALAEVVVAGEHQCDIDSGASVAEGGGESLPTVVGFLERGGNAAEIKTNTGTLVYRGPGLDTATAPPPPPPPPSPPAAPPARPAMVPTGAAATGPAPETKRRRAGSGDVLSEDEFVGTSATDAYGLVQQYRPNWLRGRGPLSITDPTAGDIQIYMNNSHWGDANRLHEIPAQDVVEMRILRGPDATMKYGVNHAAGVIEVVTR